MDAIARSSDIGAIQVMAWGEVVEVKRMRKCCNKRCHLDNAVNGLVWSIHTR